MKDRKETVIYVTREIERALGMAPSPNYHIVSNRTPYGETVKQSYPEFVTLIDGDGTESLGTGDLLIHPATKDLVEKLAAAKGSKPYILVFKNTARIEPITKEKGWIIINPPASASEKVENKITQIHWLGDMEKYLPPHRIEICKNVSWNNEPFVIQWAHGHTGLGTILVKSDIELQSIKEKFPERRCRVTKFIEGPACTVNVVVTPEKIMAGNVSYQITGLPPFTDSVFSTIGNDWGLARKLLSESEKSWIQNLSSEIGAKMQKEYWRGLFGIDIMKNEADGKLYLIEINARQPASTTFESALQEERRKNGASGLTTFEAHLSALLGDASIEPIIEITDGAQIVQRVTENTRKISDEIKGTIELDGFRALSYQNSEENADLLRIQSSNSIMSGHNEFGPQGEKILLSLKS